MSEFAKRTLAFDVLFLIPLHLSHQGLGGIDTAVLILFIALHENTFDEVRRLLISFDRFYESFHVVHGFGNEFK